CAREGARRADQHIRDVVREVGRVERARGDSRPKLVPGPAEHGDIHQIGWIKGGRHVNERVNSSVAKTLNRIEASASSHDIALARTSSRRLEWDRTGSRRSDQKVSRAVAIDIARRNRVSGPIACGCPVKRQVLLLAGDVQDLGQRCAGGQISSAQESIGSAGRGRGGDRNASRPVRNRGSGNERAQTASVYVSDRDRGAQGITGILTD